MNKLAQTESTNSKQSSLSFSYLQEITFIYCKLSLPVTFCTWCKWGILFCSFAMFFSSKGCAACQLVLVVERW